MLCDNWATAFPFTDQDFTVELEYRPSELPASNERFWLIGSYFATAPRRSWSLNYRNNAGTRTIEFVYNATGQGAGNVLVDFGPITLDTDEFQHIAISRDGEDLRCFVNGTQVGATHNIGTTSLYSIPAGEGDWLVIGTGVSNGQTSPTNYSGNERLEQQGREVEFGNECAASRGFCVAGH